MSEIKAETTSNWECVSTLIKGQKPIELGRQTAETFFHAPEKMLYLLSYYKFAAKMIGKKKRVLDRGCQEGLGTFLLAKECGVARGIDSDREAIQSAQSNFQDPNLSFQHTDSSSGWDGIVHFQGAEAKPFLWETISSQVIPEGLVVVGTPNGKLYTGERLEAEMRQFFTQVFMFAAHDEVVHTGYASFAPYLIAIGCQKKI